ncbi:MAG: hypothetical protein AB8B74_15405 [Crocinitomicaceae bacterium]
MTSVIILTQNKKSIEFWQQKLSIVKMPIYKFQTVNEVINASPQLVIIDNYFQGHDNLSWINEQTAAIKAAGYGNTIICLSPQYISMQQNQTEEKVYRHYFNQSFIDRVTMTAVA